MSMAGRAWCERRDRARVPRDFFAGAVLSIAPSAGASPPLPQDMYVWQRVWTAPLRDALAQTSDLVAGWRVLVAEQDTPGRLKPIAVDWPALAHTGRPVIAVVRIDGHLALAREPLLLAQIGSLARTWRAHGVAGLEIDYDCGVASLPAYAQFLARLRTLPSIPKRLSITALPAWLSAPGFDAVAAVPDELVLQVHAVLAPRNGLFDARLAQRWILALDSRATRPYRVALPDYGVRVVEGDDGAIVSVESEMPRLVGGARANELVASPADVAALLARAATRSAGASGGDLSGSGFRPTPTCGSGAP